MFDQTSIDEVLAALGYRPRKRLVYQAEWGKSDVEHFINLSLYGAAKAFLTADFGLRNPYAEIFSINCIRAYGGDLFKIFRPNGRIGTDCTMSFSFGRLTSKIQRWSLYLPDLSTLALAESLRSCIQDRLLPVVRDVTTLNKFLSILIADAEPCPWISTNGAIRTAQIVAVAGQIGVEMGQIPTLLKPRERYIFRDLSEISGKKVDIGWYVDKVISEWRMVSQDLKSLTRRTSSRGGLNHTQ
jgi:hypothetical protein